MANYYNEFDPYAAQWLRNLISNNLIPDGVVDERSITEVDPKDLDGFTQCHFFAGIGGWSYALSLAGWPDDRPIWTGSCPCQPFSVAGKGKGQEDERHLWPEFYRLIRARRPDVILGEQVAAAVGKSWLDGVCSDLEAIDYACGAVVVPACAVNAPHRRDRLWFVADTNSKRAYPGQRDDSPSRHRRPANAEGVPDSGNMADTVSNRRHAGRDDHTEHDWSVTPAAGHPSVAVADAYKQGPQGRVLLSERADERAPWSDRVEWAIGADGKARRVEPSIRLLAHGVPSRVGRLRAYGNAIVPQVAAEIIAAYMEQ